MSLSSDHDATVGHQLEKTAPPRFAMRGAAYLWGTQMAVTNPMSALLLSRLYNASNGQIALVIFLYNVVAMFLSWSVPRWADRHRDYLSPMVASSACSLIMCAALLTMRSLLVGSCFLIIFGAWAFVGNAMLFAYARHTGSSRKEVVTMRSVISLAWVLGAPLGTLLVATAGAKALVGLIAVLATGNFTVTSQLIRTRVPVEVVAKVKERLGVSKLGVTSLFLGFSFMQTAMSASMTVTALFAVRSLHSTSLWGGIALGLAAGLEVPALLWLRKAVMKHSEVRLISYAALAGVGYYFLMATARSGEEMLIIQVLNATFVATYAAVRLMIFQRVVPLPGAAMGLQTNSGLVGALLTGPVIGASALGPWGLRTVFVLCAGCLVLGVSLVNFSQRFVSYTNQEN